SLASARLLDPGDERRISEQHKLPHLAAILAPDLHGPLRAIPGGLVFQAEPQPAEDSKKGKKK
ncbi:MAG TPA: hypothetical protein VKI17_12320, partial [Gemmataceae bacterium]|nr:hypothetical protein [Gemmataceae bacterium]